MNIKAKKQGSRERRAEEADVKHFKPPERSQGPTKKFQRDMELNLHTRK